MHLCPSENESNREWTSKWKQIEGGGGGGGYIHRDRLKDADEQRRWMSLKDSNKPKAHIE